MHRLSQRGNSPWRPSRHGDDQGRLMDGMASKSTLCPLFASTFYWAWLFLLYWSSSVVVEEPLAFNLKGCSLLGSALVLAVWFFVMRSGKGKVFDGPVLMALPFTLSPLAGVSALVLALPIGASLPPAVHYALWFLSGCGAAFILVHMAYGIYRIKTDGVFLILALSTLISCSIATFACMRSGLSLPAIVTATVLPVAAYALSIAKGRQGDLLPRDEKPVFNGANAVAGNLGLSSAKKMPRRVFLFPLMQMLCYSVTFSFSLFIGLNGGQANMPSEFVWFGALLASIFILLYGLWLKERITLNLTQYVLFGVAAIGLAPLAIASQLQTSLLFASCALLMFSFTSFDMLSMNQLLSMIDEYKISYARYFALGRLANAAGMFLGWALAAVVIALGAAFPSWHLSQVLPMAMILILVFVVMTFSYDSMRSSESRDDISAAPVDAPTAWKTACDDICEKFALSPRECEVFALCAKGRDTAYICNELCVSNHTVRSHIYHIYGKMGIHSQQDLITVVEKRVKEIRTGKQ